MTITLTPEAEQALQAESDRQDLSPEQLAMQALIAGLRERPVPQSLRDLLPQSLRDLPQRPLPPGKHLRDLFEEFWQNHPGAETDEEVRVALSELP